MQSVAEKFAVVSSFRQTAKFIYFNGKFKYSHTRWVPISRRGVTVNKRCAGFPIRYSDGWGYPAKGAEGYERGNAP